MFLKKIKLIKYAGYKEKTFDFTKPNGDPYRFICFFGPNGYGKTSMLQAIQLLTLNTTGYSPDRVYNKLKSLVYTKSGLGAYTGITEVEYKNNWMTKKKDKKPEMTIEGLFSDGKKDYIVSLNEYGFTQNDLAPIYSSNETKEEKTNILNRGPFGKDHAAYRQRLIHMLKADSDLSMNRFQLKTNAIPMFERIISEIYSYDVKCSLPTGTLPEDMEYSVDFYVVKEDEYIPFKRMSAGEKKIAKSFSELFNIMDDLANPKRKDLNEIPMPGYPKIILIDNVEMHAYYTRHVSLVNELKKTFNHQQIFATTHSGVLIPRYLDGQNDQENEQYIDLHPVNHRKLKS